MGMTGLNTFLPYFKKNFPEKKHDDFLSPYTGELVSCDNIMVISFSLPEILSDYH
jgi:hypothetical protein